MCLHRCNVDRLQIVVRESSRISPWSEGGHAWGGGRNESGRGSEWTGGANLVPAPWPGGTDNSGSGSKEKQWRSQQDQSKERDGPFEPGSVIERSWSGGRIQVSQTELNKKKAQD